MPRKARSRRPRRYRPSSPIQLNPVRRMPRPHVTINRALAWYCLWTGANVERRLEQQLRRSGFATYRPVEALQTIQRGRVVERERNPLARYLFVGLDAAQPNFGAVRATLEGDHAESGDFSYTWRGLDVWVPVRNLIRDRPLGEFLTVDDHILKVPASALQRLADGLFVPERSASLRYRFSAGAAVRATGGPFASFLAEVESSTDDRVRALVGLFGGRISVEFEHGQLEAVA